VATPIGNLEDITLRALRTLGEADFVVAEDTRRSRTLCVHHGLSKRLKSLHAHSSSAAVERILAALLAGAKVALVTDAGTPLVSDPGAALVQAAASAGVRVESIPGPSAVTAALTVAGIVCDEFRFVGFLPRRGRKRSDALASIAADRAATVIFEAPTRVAATLNDLAQHAGGERRAAMCRELTKVHEEVARGTLAELAERFASGVRGEVTLVVAGAVEPAEKPEPTASEAADLDRRIRALLAAGQTPRDIARQVAQETGMPRRDAYRRVLALRG